MAEGNLDTISARFCMAANAVLRGDPELMLALWSHAGDVTYCDPGGSILRGWTALEPYWHRAAELSASATDKLSVNGEEVTLTRHGDIAWAVTRETVRRSNGSVVLVARATNLYQREAEGWRLVHRHADAVPRMPAKESDGNH
jgi:hypothetical protein